MEIQAWLIGQVVVPGEKWSMLDCGTEYGHSAERVKREWPTAKIHGVEVHEPTLEACREIRGEHYESLTLGNVLGISGREAYDVVLAAEIIEHMHKDDGIRLLEIVEEKATRLAIATSPLGFVPHGHIDGNPYQEHLSGWEPSDFEERGWRTFVTMPYGYGLGVYFLDKTGLL